MSDEPKVIVRWVYDEPEEIAELRRIVDELSAHGPECETFTTT